MMAAIERDAVVSTAVNSSDHGALVTITVILCSICMLLIYAVRLLIRWPWSKCLGSDDYVTGVSTLFGFVQSGLALGAVSRGFGRIDSRLSQHQEDQAYKLIYASNLFYVLSICLSQLGLTALFARLTSVPQHARYAMIVSIVSIAFGFASLLLVAIQPPYASPWSLTKEVVDGQYRRWVAVEVMMSFIDLCILLFPIWLVRGLQMPASTKRKVVFGFQARSFGIVLVVFRLISLSSLVGQGDLGFHYVKVELFTQGRMCLEVVSATIPCLHIYFRDTRTGLFVPDTMVAETSRMGPYGSGSHSRSRAGRQNKVNDFSSELTSLAKGSNVAHAEASSSRQSAASDDSRRAIVVRQTVDVRLD